MLPLSSQALPESLTLLETALHTRLQIVECSVVVFTVSRVYRKGTQQTCPKPYSLLFSPVCGYLVSESTKHRIVLLHTVCFTVFCFIL